VQDGALPQAVAEAHHLWLLRRMGFAQFGGVAHRIEVGDDSPAPSQLLADALQAGHDVIPCQRLFCLKHLLKPGLEFDELSFQLGEQTREVFADLIRRNRRVVRKTPTLEEGWLAAGGHAVKLQPRGRRLWRAIRLWVESVLARASVEAS